MPKTYTAAGSATAGDVYTASAHNVIVTDINNFIVPPLVRLTRGTAQSIANSTDTFVTWPTEVIDTDGCYTATSDTITIQTAGVYIVSASLFYTGNATGTRVCHLYKNPSSAADYASIFATCIINATTAVGVATGCSTSGLISLAANDTVKVGAFQSSGGALNLGDSSFAAATQVSLAWVGRTS